MRYLIVLLLCIPFVAMSEPYCGNGVIEAPEECDNGNAEDGDGCSALCLRETILYELRGDKDGGTLDPNVAFRRSMVTTLFLPSGLGLIYGPSMGHLYAGEGGRAALMSLARLGILSLPTLIVLGKLDSFGLNEKQTNILLVSTSLTFGALVGIDLLDGPRAVERAEKKKAIIQGRKKTEAPKTSTSSAPSSAPSTLPE